MICGMHGGPSHQEDEETQELLENSTKFSLSTKDAAQNYLCSIVL